MREIHRVVVVALVFSKDGKILMGQKDPNGGGVYADCWHFPGGGIEEGEEVKTALLRELFEEVGLDASEQRIVAFDFKNNATTLKTLKQTGEQVLCHMEFKYFGVYCETNNAEDIAVHAGDDLVALQWYTREELKHVHQIPGGIDILSTHANVWPQT